MKSRIRILLVDDNDLIRQALRLMLEPVEAIEVVGDCASAEEALSQIEKLFPDIVLMGAQMSGVNVIEVIRHLKRSRLHYDVDVIVLAKTVDYQNWVETLEAGAAGYLLKDVKHAELVQSIRQVYLTEHSLQEGGAFVEQIVELAVPSSVSADKVLEFTSQVEKTVRASILQIVASRDRTVITIATKPGTPSNLLNKLRDMPGVEKVEEEPLTKSRLSNFLNRFRALLRSETSPEKRVLITLN